MSKKVNFSPEVKFCVRYLVNHGISAVEFSKVHLQLSNDDVDFNLVPVPGSQKDFFTELAEKMRELWPAGEKDGKWPWRDSVSNLSRRIQTLWKDRGFGEKTIDECLTVARRYLAQFEDNAKYMQTLKYFILKQEEIVDKSTGRIKYINKSVFADMLESDTVMNEWGDVFESSNTFEQGELI